MVDQITFRQELGGAFALPKEKGSTWEPDPADFDILGIRFETAILDMSTAFRDQGFKVTAMRKGLDQVRFHRVSDDHQILETKTIGFEVI